jgi:hypothetical protein
MVSILGLMVENIKVNGQIIKCMAKVYLLGQIIRYTEVFNND